MNKKSKFWPWVLAWVILAILSCLYTALSFTLAYVGRCPRTGDPVGYLQYQTDLSSNKSLTEAPNMPPALANHMAEEKLNETMHTENQKVMDAIEKTTIGLANQPGAGPQKIYLLESDPYDFYNLTENIVKKAASRISLKEVNILIP